MSGSTSNPGESGAWPTDLHRRVRQQSSRMDPNPTDQAPFLRSLHGIRALAFDVYGTLVVSAAGDIGLLDPGDRETTIRETIRAVFPEASLPPEADSIDSAWKAGVNREHNRLRREGGIAFPEVDVREIWADIVQPLVGSTVTPDSPQIADLALRFELEVNPVWGMPGWHSVLQAAQAAGLPVGIASNAQFYTPIMLEALATTPMTDLGIDPACSVWSYRERIAKPSESLYRKLARRFRRGHRLEPGEILYIGNDMRNDVAPAAAVGFQTALFAGDARSLRLREGDPLVGQTRPDVILTGLDQLREVVSALKS
ncbi:MAG: HAD family hydrolase [Opitutales bacterium]